MKRTLERGFKVPEAVAGFSSGGRILIASVAAGETAQFSCSVRGFLMKKETSAKSSLFGRACTSPKVPDMSLSSPWGDGTYSVWRVSWGA